MMIACIKIVFLSKFYNYPVSRVIYEISIDKRLKRFLKIEDEVPTEGQVYAYLSRYSPDQYNNISNSFFKLFLKLNKNNRSDWIVDATPVACDINILKKYVSSEHLEKLNLDSQSKKKIIKKVIEHVKNEIENENKHLKYFVRA